MARKRHQLQLTAGDPEFVADINDRIRRLREMLTLMAPEIGSSALGATLPYLRPPQPRETLLLPSPDAANF
jgi:hypothetical protein